MMISIVIPTCTYSLVKKCVDSIIKYTDLNDVEIILVANGAEPKTTYIGDYPNCRVLWFDSRLGPTRALNEGIKVAVGEYVVLLNDDVELLEQPKNQWIEMLKDPFSDLKTGISGPIKTISPTVGKEFIIFFCAMMRRSIFDEIGLLDETFQCGCDMDFCMRVKEKGYSIIQVPDNLLTTGPQFWQGNFPIYHKAEGTVHVVIPPEEWHKIFTSDTERLVERYGVGKKIDFSIVIPTCTLEYLRKSISSIVANTNLSNGEVIVVANGAEPDTKSFVTTLGSCFRIIWFDERIGSTKALNEGIKVAKGEYIILLNDDVVILGKEWLPMLMEPFKDPDVGITGPLMGTILAANGYHDSISDRRFMIFFCCAIRRAVFDEIGLLDEIFSPGIFEDVDFGLKADDAGWKSVQVPDTAPIVGGGVFKSDFPIWHKEGTTVTTTKNFWDIYKKNLKIINDRYGVIKVDWLCNQKKPELDMLQRFLKGHKIERVLEIGTQRGGTATLWAKMIEPYNGKVFCVDRIFDWDIYTDSIYGNYKGQVYDNIPQSKFITELKGDSHDPDFKKKIINEVGQVDLLFIDGDHSYEGVKEDFNTYSKLVKPGGFVVFHDIIDSEYHRLIGVYVNQLWNEIKSNYEYQEFIHDSEYGIFPRECMGIGVLKIPDIIKVDWVCDQKKSELDMLQKFLKGNKIAKILEIGTHRGSSATLWAKMVESHEGKVYCIDPHFDYANWEPSSRYGNYKGQVYSDMPQRKFIIELQGNSHDPNIKKIVRDEVGQIDMLFIDGDHSYNGVKDDFDTYGSLVRPGGFIVFHDIVDSEYHRNNGCFVASFWNEINNSYEYKEFIDAAAYEDTPSQSMGIGVLKVPDKDIKFKTDVAKFSIIIPTFNHCDDLLKPCIDSVVKYTDLSSVEVIVVANGCTDNTKQYVESLGKPFKLIWFDNSLGYTKAINEGMKVAQGDYIIPLNNDVVLLKQLKNTWIDMLVAPFANESVGITGPMKMFCPYSEREFILFFCAMFKRKVLDEVGFLDEIFSPGFGEDVDFCIKLQKKKYQIVQVPFESQDYYVPGTGKMTGGFPIYHLGQATFNNASNDIINLLAKNRDLLYQRYSLRAKYGNNWERWVADKTSYLRPIEHGRYKWVGENIVGNKILEIGTSSGYGLRYFGNIKDLDYLGIDRDKNVIEFARETFGDIPGVKFECADINSFNFGQYNTIIAMETLEHLDNGREVAQKLKKHCKRILLSVPYREKPGMLGIHHRIHNLTQDDFPGFEYFMLKGDGTVVDFDNYIFNPDIIDSMLLVWDNGSSIRLNLGCGDLKIDNYINIDLYNPTADIKADVRNLSSFQDGSVDEILAIHVFEHLSPFDAVPTLQEWFRVLKSGGNLFIEVPDILQLCKHFEERDKAGRYELLNCIYGTTQLPRGHLFGWYDEILKEHLAIAGFTNIKISTPQFKHWGYSLRIECNKP